MKIVFAQGNPGAQYARSRHNTGFMAIDELASSHQTTWKPSKIAPALCAEISLNGQKLLLIKPSSYYNQTGPVLQAFLHFYKLEPANNVLVIHDELALPFGTIRVREKGSDAGNNGIKSINQNIGQNYWRLRVGIFNEQRNLLDDADFVLAGFSKEEKEDLPEIVSKAIGLIGDFAADKLELKTH